jgi:hypothetical protein
VSSDAQAMQCCAPVAVHPTPKAWAAPVAPSTSAQLLAMVPPRKTLLWSLFAVRHWT